MDQDHKDKYSVLTWFCFLLGMAVIYWALSVK